MIKVFFGKKGMGKTKSMVDEANKLSAQSAGDVVFVDDSKQLMYDLKHKIRFINVSEFPVSGQESFFGFLCGLIAEDYDIDGIFVDGLSYIVDDEIGTLEGFFKKLEDLSQRFNIKFYLSINGDPAAMPEFLKQYAL